jgi:uncharacterized protein YqgC (DUF456 family)
LDCSQIFWGLLAASPFLIVGLIGTAVPILPGAPMILIGLALYFWITHFSQLTAPLLIGQTLLAASTFVVDFIAASWGVRRAGGSKASAWGAVLGTAMVFVAGPWGIVIGPVLGAVIAEMITGKALKQAVRSGIGSLWGILGGTIAKLIIVGTMIAWFLWEIGPQATECMPWNQ